MGIGWIAQLVAGALVGARASSRVVKHADQWFELTMSLGGTSLVTFLGIFGAVGGATLAGGASVSVSIATGLFMGCSATAAAIYGIWRRSTLTKGISLLAPMRVAQDELDTDTVLIEPRKER